MIRLSMRFLLVAWLVQLFVACQAPVTAPREPSVGPPSVSRIYIEERWYGTAWHAGHGVWITADHICEDYVSSATIGDAPAYPLKRGFWTSKDGQDLCALSGPDAAAYFPLGHEPVFGERLVYIGYPEGHLGVYEGLYSGVDDQTGEPMFSAFAWGGASGSPVINMSGEVVGVLVSGFRGRPYTYFEPVADLVNFLAE